MKITLAIHFLSAKRPSFMVEGLDLDLFTIHPLGDSNHRLISKTNAPDWGHYFPAVGQLRFKDDRLLFIGIPNGSNFSHLYEIIFDKTQQEFLPPGWKSGFPLNYKPDLLLNDGVFDWLLMPKPQKQHQLPDPPPDYQNADFLEPPRRGRKPKLENTPRGISMQTHIFTYRGKELAPLLRNLIERLTKEIQKTQKDRNTILDSRNKTPIPIVKTGKSVQLEQVDDYSRELLSRLNRARSWLIECDRSSWLKKHHLDLEDLDWVYCRELGD